MTFGNVMLGPARGTQAEPSNHSDGSPFANGFSSNPFFPYLTQSAGAADSRGGGAVPDISVGQVCHQDSGLQHL